MDFAGRATHRNIKKHVSARAGGVYLSSTHPLLSITSKKEWRLGFGLHGGTVSPESLLLTDQLHCTSLMLFASNRLIPVS